MKASDLKQSTGQIKTLQPPIKNVEAKFSRISRRGEYFSLHPYDEMPRWLYTMSGNYNNNGYQNHFQGIQPLQDKNYFVVSGGDWKNSKSDLFIAKMDSRPEKGPWWSNITTTPDPPLSDAVMAAIELDEKHWHAGGMDIQGDILAVPVEYSPPGTIPPLFGFQAPPHGNEESSKVMFFDLNNPTNPKIIPIEITRKKAKAGAVALTRLLNGYFFAAVWTDSDQNPKRLDFYLSKSEKIMNGFQNKSWTWYPDDVYSIGDQDRNFSDFQTINFVLQDDGQLYLAGLHNTAAMAPVQGGKNYADLYLVELAKETLQQNPVIDPNKKPKLTKVANACFKCLNRQCNFDAGAGFYINNGDLFLYSTFHYRGPKGILKFNEYLPPYKGISGLLTRDNAWLEMFQESHFCGRRLAIRGLSSMTQPNLGNVMAEKKGFKDSAHSIRFQLPNETKCLVYKHKNFKEKLSLELKGTGNVEEIPVLPDNIRGRISSVKLLN
ncbi:MAG: hypothetical protein JXB26_08510 [Candidatus Aminicenantes bacterium]|nr:hypothetical protein [Candidatus Aminicenantes bacterium]